LARAKVASRVEAWGDAIRLWEAVIARNPVAGQFWAQLAEARYRGGAYRSAIEACEQAVSLGAGYPAESMYRIACCHARLDEREAAITALQRAFDRGFRHVERAQTDPDLRVLHDDARFRDIVGLTDTTAFSRDAGWRSDLALLAREVKRLGYSPFRLVSEAQFDARVADVHDAIPRLTDVQIAVEFVKLMQLAGDGHTRLNDLTSHPELCQTLPMQFSLFEEGLYITAADPKHADLLGAQVTQIAGRPVSECFDALAPLISRDNDQWLKQMTPYRLREIPILHALGLTDEPNRIALTICDRGERTRVVTLATDASQPDIWNAIPYPVGWQFFPETLPAPLPHYLRNAGAHYWFDDLADARAVYFQFNRVRDDPEEPLRDFFARLFRCIEERAVERLVIDLRWNNGGNTCLEMPLLYGLIACDRINQPGKPFVIIGRRTSMLIIAAHSG
jgi:hypothetical protein